MAVRHRTYFLDAIAVLLREVLELLISSKALIARQARAPI